MKIYLINSLIIALAVGIHYEVLFQLSRRVPSLNIASRFKVIIGVFGALCAHVAEIWLFYYWLSRDNSLGTLSGNYAGTIEDSVYFSFSSYTSLGIGDIEPLGDLRFLAGLESLLGLVLISWTASFLFLEMTRYWKET